MTIIITDKNGDELGRFYIPNDANKEYLLRNLPPLFQAIQLLAGYIEKTDY